MSVTEVAVISPMQSVKTADIAAESICLPRYLLKTASQSLPPIESKSTTTAGTEKTTDSGFLIFSIDDLMSS